MMDISIARCRLETQGSFFSIISRTIVQEHAQKWPHNVAAHGSRWGFHRLTSSYQSLPAEYPRRAFVCRTYSLTSSLEESASLQPCTTEQITALLADTERSKLTKKLSEANQQNRFLKRQLHIKEEALVKFKSELAVMGLEVQALARLAGEIAQSGIPQGARKINGKYIHSHLVARLEAVHEQLKEQIKDVDAAQSKQISVFWVGMAESVQVMGSFDGWSQGEHLSPEYTGSYTRFSTTLMLRPGRYEIKFFVDGEWHLSPEFPIIGDGLTKNNLLVVK
ncbi:putative [Hydroxymethylglutaryl-CoA reductase (NADPH)] kinase [Lupinus albus]|uniref:Putative [Hydroxymethylglutaryl-CoA reductase (NADPH)] kinase n=1 Tax=Lupinus albus TaxID=3870 RepID=A0A6A4NZ12_LUPAL|nr:putative [Hydroxymethylglutaryl-CoA reductase (NADPH)] kinase [Lupinus albus]